jgi:hypothetical protein
MLAAAPKSFLNRGKRPGRPQARAVRADALPSGHGCLAAARHDIWRRRHCCKAHVTSKLFPQLRPIRIWTAAMSSSRFWSPPARSRRGVTAAPTRLQDDGGKIPCDSGQLLGAFVLAQLQLSAQNICFMHEARAAGSMSGGVRTWRAPRRGCR